MKIYKHSVIRSSLQLGRKFSNISYERAIRLYEEFPVGTKIKMTEHTTGDYVGEYTKIDPSTWEGSQKYLSNRRRPPTVSTAKGFAMQVVGKDVNVI